MSMIGNLLRVSPQELEDYLNDSALLEEKIDSAEDSELMDIDRSWEGLLYILTGCTTTNMETAPPPLAWITFGAHVVDEEQEIGYGPACYCMHSEVKQLHNALGAIDMPAFKTMLLQSGLINNTEIYPSIKWSGSDEALSYYGQYFGLIKEFYARAAKNNEAVITFIS